METFLLVLHPIIQGFAVLLGIYAMWQGWKRVEMTVLKKKIIFPWRSHVHCGTIAMILWLLGGLGFYTTHSIFGETHITGSYAHLAWVIFAFCIFGLANGYIMDKYKKKRTWLPAVHGVANAILLVLVFYECYTGFELLDTFL